MANFQIALESLLAEEGGFNQKNGHAGAVNFGITSRFLEGIGLDGSPETVRNMTQERAEEIYRTHFWEPFRLGQIDDQRLATMMFHLVVNMGPYWPIRYAQEVLEDDFNIAVGKDGIIGPRTLAGLNQMSGPDLDRFIQNWKELLLIRYRHIARDATLAKYLPGWEKRLQNL